MSGLSLGRKPPLRAHGEDSPRPKFMLRHERRIAQKPTAMATAMLWTEYLWRRRSRLGLSERSVLASVAQDYPAHPLPVRRLLPNLSNPIPAGARCPEFRSHRCPNWPPYN
jgi:hypothetical protein